DQKGMQLLQEKAEYLLTNCNIQIVVLGTGDEAFENSFRYFEWKYPGEFCAYIDFDVELAQQIYAGSDMFLMPSAFEPCGLSQMIAMRYGTLPLVHETGGLKDTVMPYNSYTGEGTGFSFYGFNGYNLLGTIYRALDVYEEQPQAWELLMKQAMEKDFSWKQPSQHYIELYQSLCQ
uniref:glycogen synthase n=1 Tax=Jeotgalibaca arthritidis TaxID=1868794 RepID=UPI0035A0157B